ncbi:Acyl-coenzyme A thioesterase 9, mitochondrial [Dinochytrium kinnereticum]|nr:Acyl-coenzyme A thioesterase 9, mitochondrial [Dinochytrium kinnereticum]
MWGHSIARLTIQRRAVLPTFPPHITRIAAVRSLSSDQTTSRKYPPADPEDDPQLRTVPSPEARWSVLPQLRGRSAATNRLWINRYLERKESAKTDSKPQTKPVPILKSMSDSFVDEYLLFKSEEGVREDYVNSYGSIRIGKVLEDLDALAGSVAYRHCDDGRDDTPPLTIVTASVDRIDMINRIPVDKDICLSGCVTYVGTSSMEISLKMETLPDGISPAELFTKSAAERVSMFATSPGVKPILAAKFTMVARDNETNKAAKVNQLKLESEEERRLFRLGAEQKARKKVASQTSLTKIPPSTEEMLLVHDLYLETKKYLDPSARTPKPDNAIWMEDTIQRSLVMCMPQDRNIHNFIFGGYLMRLAYELSYSTAIIFSKSRVYFVALDDITFKLPVPIGSLLSLSAQVVYSAGSPSRSFQVRVRADVIDPLKGQSDMSNESSGVQVSNEVITLFEEMKLRRKYAFMVFKIQESLIVPDLIYTTEQADIAGTDATFQAFVNQMPAEEGRYGVFDFEYDSGSDGIRNKLVFFLWAPDTSKIRSRMLYASSKLAIRQRLDGIHTEIQCTDSAELAYESVFEKLAPKGAVPLHRPPKA